MKSTGTAFLASGEVDTIQTRLSSLAGVSFTIIREVSVAPPGSGRPNARTKGGKGGTQPCHWAPPDDVAPGLVEKLERATCCATDVSIVEPMAMFRPRQKKLVGGPFS